MHINYNHGFNEEVFIILINISWCIRLCIKRLSEIIFKNYSLKLKLKEIHRNLDSYLITLLGHMLAIWEWQIWENKKILGIPCVFKQCSVRSVSTEWSKQHLIWVQAVHQGLSFNRKQSSYITKILIKEPRIIQFLKHFLKKLVQLLTISMFPHKDFL